MISNALALLLLTWPLALSALDQGGPGAPTQWIVENAVGEWQVLQGARWQTMDRSTVLVKGMQIRCLAGGCQLFYSSFENGKLALNAFPFDLDVGEGRRATLLRLPREQTYIVPNPEHPPAPAVPMAAQLLGRLNEVGTIAGRPKGGQTDALCSGTFTLTAPSCGESVDPLDFTLTWRPASVEGSGAMVLIAEVLDSFEVRRWSGITMAAGTYGAESLRTYFASLQQPDRPTGVRLRLARSDDVSATSVIEVMSKAEAAEHRRRIVELDQLTPLSQRLAALGEYLRARRYSAAAGVALKLLQDHPNDLEIHKYVVLGLCGSPWSDEAAQIRSKLETAGVSGYCTQGTTR